MDTKAVSYSPRDVKIPKRLEDRPRYFDLPIPFMTLVVNNIPDFRATDAAKRDEVIFNNLCALCGQLNASRIWLIGGENCVEHRLFYDPGMHYQCAAYSLTVCPYLALRDKQYSTRALPELPGGTVVTDELMSTERPVKMVLAGTDGYKLVPFEGRLLVKANPWNKLIWFESGLEARV